MSAAAMLAHNVYFTLVNNSPQAKEELVAACREFLSNHPGTVLFAAGVLAEDVDSSVNDRDFDVALHLIFESKAAHDEYQDSPRHSEFLEKYGGNWKALRAFDEYVQCS